MLRKVLTLEEIKSITLGVVRLEETDGKISFHRFTKEQEAFYEKERRELAYKVFATAGVRMEFYTDSEKLEFSVEVSRASSRNFFTHSIFVNEERIGELSGELDTEKNKIICSTKVELGKGKKKVKIIFPWSAVSQILSFELDMHAYVIPIKKQRRMLQFGDSITQGYTALKPENTYASQLTDMLAVDSINKGIGGEVFMSQLATLKDNFEPELITVAYGTNDWSHRTQEEFEAECLLFYYNLRKTYPKSKIVAFTPIWKVEMQSDYIQQPISYIGDYIKKISEKTENMQVINCIDFVPHDMSYFEDVVHPNDRGFHFYGEGLKANETKFRTN